MGAAHLISGFATPLDHFWYRLFVHAAAGLPDGIDNGKVGLQRVQRRDRSLHPSAPSAVTTVERHVDDG